MDIKVLKKECNDLIDELESLQRTDANLDQQIREFKIGYFLFLERTGTRDNKGKDTFFYLGVFFALFSGFSLLMLCMILENYYL